MKRILKRSIVSVCAVMLTMCVLIVESPAQDLRNPSSEFASAWKSYNDAKKASAEAEQEANVAFQEGKALAVEYLKACEEGDGRKIKKIAGDLQDYGEYAVVCCEKALEAKEREKQTRERLFPGLSKLKDELKLSLTKDDRVEPIDSGNSGQTNLSRVAQFTEHLREHGPKDRTSGASERGMKAMHIVSGSVRYDFGGKRGLKELVNAMTQPRANASRSTGHGPKVTSAAGAILNSRVNPAIPSASSLEKPRRVASIAAVNARRPRCSGRTPATPILSTRQVAVATPLVALSGRR